MINVMQLSTANLRADLQKQPCWEQT